jgi:hypothetical protein
MRKCTPSYAVALTGFLLELLNLRIKKKVPIINRDPAAMGLGMSNKVLFCCFPEINSESFQLLLEEDCSA